jgi:hypothetical protein
MTQQPEDEEREERISREIIVETGQIRTLVLS